MARSEYAYFPVPMHEPPGPRLDFEELGEGELMIGDVRVRTQYLDHTAPCIGYRLEERGATLVYATDHELHAPALWRPGPRHRPLRFRRRCSTPPTPATPSSCAMPTS